VLIPKPARVDSGGWVSNKPWVIPKVLFQSTERVKKVVSFVESVVLCSVFLFAAHSQNGWAAEGKPDQSCRFVLAPDSSLSFRPARPTTSGRPTNQGVVPRGFVALKDGSPTVHGVDVSKWQSAVDFKRVSDCGGVFAYVRLSAGTKPENELEYRVHWSNARAVQLMVGPYHYLTIPTINRKFSKSEVLDEAKLKSDIFASSKSQAKHFTDRVLEVLKLDVKASTAASNELGLPILPIALAIGENPLASTGLSQSQAQVIASLYRDAICTWIKEVRQTPQLKGVPIMLLTHPFLYKDYRFNESECGLDKLPLWISYGTADGGRYASSPNTTDSLLRDICLQGGGDRCIFHLYTSFGNFLSFDDSAVDLDRFYGTLDQLTKLLSQIRVQ
jgi:GH25 family lysozyme M1 (1,4-beta-N-acetylmuramidase)